MADEFEFEKITGGVSTGASKQVIKVLGIGGCGNKAVNHMIQQGLVGPEYVALNSDPQDLDNCLATTKLLIGEKVTKRGGCGGNPDKGRQACMESIERIMDLLAGTDMLFITAGMGGGTGSGGAPVIAEALSKLEDPPLVVGVVTTPFSYEKQRMGISDEVVKLLSAHCNSIITVSNAKLQDTAPKGTTLQQALAMANDILYKAVAGIIEILTKPGILNNLDFKDIQAVLGVKGPGLIGLGEASGEDRGKKALKNAINSPLMGNNTIQGAKRILVNFTGDDSVLFEEFTEVNTIATEMADEGAMVFAGMVCDNSLKEEGLVRVTVIATGLGSEQDQWDAPTRSEIDRVSDEIITLDNYAEDTEVIVRAEPDHLPHVPRFAAPAAKPPMPVQPFQPPIPQVQQPPRQLQAPLRPHPGQVPQFKRNSKYESNSSVDPGQQGPRFTPSDNPQGVETINKDPKKFEKPSFMRKGQN
ncbi:MAG: cell division protein FtsZ [Deltaproteobacteria bacterium]|jgi:cell division protein FtsZ|nr:cell division protein FtsZ [Deltaproteobacteria bacterium]